MFQTEISYYRMHNFIEEEELLICKVVIKYIRKKMSYLVLHYDNIYIPNGM